MTGAHLVITGCDGACFAAPQVVVNEPDGRTRYYGSVSAADVPGIVGALGQRAGLAPFLRTGRVFHSPAPPGHVLVRPVGTSRCAGLRLRGRLCQPGRRVVPHAGGGNRAGTGIRPAGTGRRLLSAGSQVARAPGLFRSPGSWWSMPRKGSPGSSRTATSWRDCPTACWKAL